MTLGPIDHLTLDAVVAYADGEMPMVAFQRAAAHVAQCPQCDAEVRAQVLARTWLRSAQAPTMPNSLLDALRSIPVVLPSAGSDDHPGTDRPRTGGFGRPETPHQRNAHRSRRFRFLGAGALVAGLTVGALIGADSLSDPDPQPDGRGIAHVSPPTASQVVIAGWDNP